MTLSERIIDFWQRITPSERRTIIIAGIAFPLVLVLALGLSIMDKLDARAQNVETMRRALAAMVNLRAAGTPASEAGDVPTLPDKPVSLDTYLSKAAEKAGLRLERISPLPSTETSTHVMHSVATDVRDLPLDKLGKFLQEVENGDASVVVTKLGISRDYKEKDKVDAKLEVSAYAKPVAKPAGKDSK